ncbi:EF-hand domain-containing protein [Pseudomonas sp. MT3]|uniref:EF-hand domain-containing protein n=1 Tax=Pseudomonas sp. ATCC 13867 TaxID=1294143 RepID=UPI0002C4F14F|nr:EF-hand domain-containing protein [Pseudomonas sp. ATCC 13867]AGI26151.1 putative signal transduction protein with EFhand domain [Pseudomonas sp. ATCC 13867]RFQ22983.1 EF-hand domain-containing protein [Pseudomonas sp. ATCC 13867]
MRSRIRHALLCSVVLLGSQQALAGEMGETAFSRLDRDANGYIEASDMAAMRERMFHRLDRDQSGFLSREELTPPSQSSHPAPNAVVWPDKDGDGKVSITEFLAQEPALILRGDRDGDHRLSAQEFQQLIAAHGR